MWLDQLQPSNHTKLMNYVIGMCKKDAHWVTILSDLGYEAQIIEQRINTSTGQVVKPDIIAVSNKLIHSMVFECKGGTMIDVNQLKRYSTLTVDNLLRWIDVFDRNNLKFDVCIGDLKENHTSIVMINDLFPMLTFDSQQLFKTRDFTRQKLNDAFREPISLKDKVPPLSYYPFSEEDDDAYIALHVIRALMDIALKNIKGNPTVSEEKLISCDDIVAQRFNHVWNALSQEHKENLKRKIREIIRRLMAREELKEALAIIQQKQGYKINQNLKQFKKEAEEFIEELQSQKPLADFI